MVRHLEGSSTLQSRYDRGGAFVRLKDTVNSKHAVVGVERDVIMSIDDRRRRLTDRLVRLRREEKCWICAWDFEY